MSNTDRLADLQAKFDRGLEQHITKLMAKVHTVTEINRQLAEVEDQVSGSQSEIEMLQEVLGGLATGSDDHQEATARVDELKEAIQEMDSIADELVSALDSVVDGLNGI